jgi:hypothetical protein
MKKYIFIIGIVAFLGSSVFSQQKSNILEVVKTALSKTYPNAKSIKWDKEESNYEASFKIDNLDHSVLFDAKGNILESEVAVKELPKNVLEYLNKNYPNQKITELAKITDAKGVVTYEAEIKGKDLIFDANGKFLKINK